ncbi:MAG: AAA family ATPase [Betaproteobacteria bacterium]|nr:AAA family ATPase [Betaproteobacteria bacterium]
MSSSGISKGFTLRDFQLRAVLQAACGDGQLAVQIAGSGLGKTTASQFTKAILASQGRRILGVAPSNKAASGLGRELGIEACSLDRLLIDLESDRLVLDRNCVVFVDEAGMASFDGMEKLFTFAKVSGAKLILTGDPEQLPAVARGNVLRKLTQMDSLVANPDALLYLGKDLKDWDRVSRQKEDWAKQASTFFSRGYVDEGLREYERRGCVHAALTLDHLGEEVARAYLKDPALPSQKLILATTNDQVRSLNARVRSELKKSGALTGSWVLPGMSGMELSLGDRVVFKARLKGDQAGLNTDVAKNEFGTVLSVQRLADGSLDIQCQLDSPASVRKGKPQIARFNSSSLEDLDHAFATTVHRSQGMTVDSVIAVPGSFCQRNCSICHGDAASEELTDSSAGVGQALHSGKCGQGDGEAACAGFSFGGLSGGGLARRGPCSAVTVQREAG